MSELRTCSVPFLRPIFARVASILLLSCGSDWPELGRGSPAQSRTQQATAATKAIPKRIGGRAAYDIAAKSPANRDSGPRTEARQESLRIRKSAPAIVIGTM